MSDKEPRNSRSHLKDVALLFAVPIAVAIFAAAVIYIPRLFANPKYDFIYSICEDYRCSDRYWVDISGYIVHDSSSSSSLNRYDRATASLRYYDSANDSTRSLTLEEAQQYRLNTSSRSPDGYTLSRESSSGGFLFWDDYTEGWYFKNGVRKKRVELANNGSYYTRDVTFLGWVNK